ncbi:MAG: efflux RND transporter periplasmic adaptor subunit [Chloroflexi bacterium]|nr:efflux RND transporter periplasmic adaptor subunit [Chloroflexota bacterium]
MNRARACAVARLVLLGTLLAGCSAISGGNGTRASVAGGGRPATVVTVARVISGPIAQTATYTGTVQAADSVNIAPQVSGRITKLNVDVGSRVKAGQIIAELDKSILSAQVAQAQAGLDAAEVKLAQIQAGARPEAADAAAANAKAAAAKLHALQAGPRPETVAQAKANLDAARAKLAAIQAGPRPENVAAAKANLDAAQAKLQALLDGPTPDQVAAAQLQVQQAKNALAAAQANKDGQCNPRNPSYLCEAAQAQAFAAETAVQVAEQNLKTLTDPPTQDAINQAKAAVDAAEQQYKLAQQPYTAQDLAQAKAAVDAAEQQYQLALKPYTDDDIAQAAAAAQAATDQAKLAAQPYTSLDLKAAQAAVEQAKAALQIAQAQLAQADIVAPFDGIVTAKYLSVGALASPSTPIVALMSPHLQVQFSIEESRVGNISVGQEVNLSSEAFPGKQLPARVVSIFPSADPKTHTFNVLVEPTDTNTPLRAGMFVSLALQIASFSNATLVPNVAIVQRGEQPVVFVVNDGTVHLQPVTVGISDDKNTQILSGVKVGDTVVTSGQANLDDGSPVRVATSGSTAGPSVAGRGRGAGPGATAPRPGSRPAASPTGRAGS